MSSQTSSGGIGFIGLLQIVFIVLKLIGKIDWSIFSMLMLTSHLRRNPCFRLHPRLHS